MFKRVVSQVVVENLQAQSHQTWQEKVLSTVYDDAADWLFFHLDNASICHCPQVEECGSSEKDSLILLILRWTKILVFKLVRSYCALPIVLVAIPLLAGVVVGFVLGRMYNNNDESNKEKGQQRSPARRENYDIGLSSQRRSFSSYISRCLFVPTCNVLSFFATAPANDDVTCMSKSLLSGSSSSRSRRGGGTTTKAAASGSVCTGEPHQAAQSSMHKEEAPPPENNGNDAKQHFPSTPTEMEEREECVRRELKSCAETSRESGVDVQDIPKHVAIIMDGNRRYGKAVYDNATSGHWDGSRKLLQVAKWCISERIEILTVYAFSTENWRRDPAEVASLMAIFAKYCEELRQEAMERNIRVHVISSDASRIPHHVKTGLERLQNDTATCKGGLVMNICLSYGSRGEIVNACRRLAQECALGKLDAKEITEEQVHAALLTHHCPDPDVLIRTSGEYRLSNFLLWQLAYTELFFVDRNWPEFEKRDLIDVIRSFAKGRRRRFGQ